MTSFFVGYFERKDGLPSFGIVADPAAPVGRRGVERQSESTNGVFGHKTPGQLNISLGSVSEIIK